MTLAKAIEILKSEQKHGVIANMDDWNDAIKLGIKALKARKRDRVCKGNYVDNLLPGETKD